MRLYTLIENKFTVFIIFVLINFLIVLIIYAKANYRMVVMSKFAKRNNLNFTKKEFLNETQIANFNLFANKDSNHIYNIVEGKKYDIDWKIFLYKLYNHSTGRLDEYIVARLYHKKKIPNMILAHKNMLNKIPNIFNYPKIDINTYTSFNLSYVIKGDDLFFIKHFFNELLIRRLETDVFSGVIEIKDNEVLLYKKNISTFDNFIVELKTIINLL